MPEKEEVYQRLSQKHTCSLLQNRQEMVVVEPTKRLDDEENEEAPSSSPVRMDRI
jgi:hypothetical protein